jgi:Glycosyl transferase family 2
MKPDEPATSTSTAQQICVIGIFRNEAPYIIEWIAHHRLLGIRQFYIADNDSDDGSRQILRKLEETGYCKWIPWKTDSKVKPQLPAYRELLSMVPEITDWVAFLDADEYIWPTSDVKLGKFLGSIPDNIGAIAMNWAVYGSSEYYEYAQGPTTIRFTWHADKTRDANLNFKTFARPPPSSTSPARTMLFWPKGTDIFTQISHQKLHSSPQTDQQDTSTAKALLSAGSFSELITISSDHGVSSITRRQGAGELTANHHFSRSTSGVMISMTRRKYPVQHILLHYKPNWTKLNAQLG